ncbi:uncharacterized protein LOC144824368 [Lissotriton helveticus]
MASTSAPRSHQPAPTVGSELRGLKRQAITLGVMTAVSTFVTIVLYRLVEREIFYNPKARSSADLQSYAKSCAGLQHVVQNDDQSFQTSVASLLKTTRCLRPAEKNHILFQKAVTQCYQRNKQGGASGQDFTCARHKPGTEDASPWMGLIPYLRETLCLPTECSGQTDIKADIVFLIYFNFDGFYNESSDLWSFMGAVVRSFHESPDSVRFALVAYTDDGEARLGFRVTDIVDSLTRELRLQDFDLLDPYTTTGEAFTWVRQRVLAERWGGRAHVARVIILITGRGPHGDPGGPVQELHQAGVEVFVVGVLDAIHSRDQLEAIASPPAAAHVFIGNRFKDLHLILPELTASICLRVQYTMKTIKHSLMVPKGEEAEAGAKGEEAEAGAKGEEAEAGAKGEEAEAGAKGEEAEAGAKGEEAEAGAKEEEAEAGAKEEEAEAGAKEEEAEAGEP